MSTDTDIPPVPEGFQRLAAIDIGTVTTRMLVADTDGVTVHEVARDTVVTHLGEGLHATGSLSEAGIARVAEAVRGFMDVFLSVGADTVVAVATSAARDAANGALFVAALARLGVELRIISGSSEARLSFAGATYGLDDDDVLVADLGGGSTELIFGSAHDTLSGRDVDIEAARSLDVGSRRVTDMFLASDPPRPEELRAASEWVAAELRPFFDALRLRPRTLITLAGTGTTLSAVKQQLAVYDPERVHHSELSGADVADLRAEFGAMSLAQRRAVTGMDPARADVIVAGALILETILALAGVERTVVSEHDLLYGIVLEAADGSR